MQGLTWWRGAPEAVTRGAASVVDEWGVVVGAAALEGEKRRKPWLRCCPWRTGDSQQTSGTNISLRSLPSFFSILRLTGFMYVGVRFISEAPFLKGARSSRAISFEITSLFLFFQSTADAAKQARLPSRGDKFTFTRKLVWTVRTWSKAAEANAQKYRGLFNARAKRL